MSRIGYWIGSHVLHNHIATVQLISTLVCNNKIEPERIAVLVNGAQRSYDQCVFGTHYFFRPADNRHHLAYCAEEGWGAKLGITHWFFLNCTSRAGQCFRYLVEAGFDPKAEATSATKYVLQGNRPINDLAMYSAAFLERIKTQVGHLVCSGKEAIDHEGYIFSLAQTKTFYPKCDYQIKGMTDVYGTGLMRRTEYFPAVDLYRYKKNWGQQVPGEYDALAL